MDNGRARVCAASRTQPSVQCIRRTSLTQLVDDRGKYALTVALPALLSSAYPPLRLPTIDRSTTSQLKILNLLSLHLHLPASPPLFRMTSAADLPQQLTRQFLVLYLLKPQCGGQSSSSLAFWPLSLRLCLSPPRSQTTIHQVLSTSPRSRHHSPDLSCSAR